jgi:hypothetical protein
MRKERFPNQRNQNYSLVVMVHFRFYRESMTTHTKLIFQVSIMLVLPLMLLILRSLTQVLIRGERG